MKTSDSKDILSSLAGSGTDHITTRPVIMGTNGMVTSGHYLASRIGLSILEDGGNAVDAAVAAMLTLTVVEPMMVGIAGGGISHIRLADGRHVVIDALSTAARLPPPAPITSMSTIGARIG